MNNNIHCCCCCCLLLLLLLDPVVVCAENIQVAAVAWNYNGSILAVAGDQLDRNMCVIHFYNITGKV